MRAKLATLRGRKAAVVAWGLPSDHRHVVVTNGSKDGMRREAMAALRDAGVETRGMLGDVIAATPHFAGMTHQPVVIAIAAAHEISSAVQPLVDAGVHVQTVVTPPLALASLARMRRAFTVPDMTEAYVALEESMTSFALMRNGALVAARDVAWGYLKDPSVGAEPLPREEIAARLAGELQHFIGAGEIRHGSETQVCICGSLPELRSMTVPLMERLDLEVETLDSRFTIDAARLPEPTDEFLEQSAELRLAWAVAADWPQPINLLRERQRRQRKTTFAVAAVAAGVAVGVGTGWKIEQSAWWRSTASRPVARATHSFPRPSAARQTALAPRSTPPKQAPTALMAMARPEPAAMPAIVKPPVVNAPPRVVEATRSLPPPVVKAVVPPPAAAIPKLPPPPSAPVPVKLPPVMAPCRHRPVNRPVPPVVPVRPAVIVHPLAPVPAAVPSRPAVVAPSLVTAPPAALLTHRAAALGLPGDTATPCCPTEARQPRCRWCALLAPVESVVPSARHSPPPDQAAAAKPAPAQVALSARRRRCSVRRRLRVAFSRSPSQRLAV